jgi:hypothetical protein
MAIAATGASTALAQAPPAGGAGRVEVSIAAAVSRPADSVFREAYGDVVVPLSAQLEVPVGWKGLFAFGGARYVRASGEASSMGLLPVVVPLRFRQSSVRAGLGWRFRAGACAVSLAGGPSLNWYREQWEGFGLVVTGREPGLVAQLSASRPISRRFGLVARGEFTTANADPRQDPTLPEANLGGVDLGAGLVFRF